ncbi:MAG: hypothetical protein U5J95_03560 [Balneolaceae bacterium]|nr:hypothetical protein [Balneolaceae bacterium]
MASNRNLQKQNKGELKAIFEETTDFILKTFGKKAFRPTGAINAAVVDSLMTGIAERLKKWENESALETAS